MQGKPLVILEGFRLVNRPVGGGDQDDKESTTPGTGCIWLDNSSVISIRKGPPDDPWVVIHDGLRGSPLPGTEHLAKRARTATTTKTATPSGVAGAAAAASSAACNAGPAAAATGARNATSTVQSNEQQLDDYTTVAKLPSVRFGQHFNIWALVSFASGPKKAEKKDWNLFLKVGRTDIDQVQRRCVLVHSHLRPLPPTCSVRVQLQMSPSQARTTSSVGPPLPSQIHSSDVVSSVPSP
jgi:hypothetical protein